MNREQIEKAAKEAVQEHFQCNGKYACEERNYCEFCNGHNSAFDCKEDCTADSFSEGFFSGADWRISSVWHNLPNDLPEKENTWILLELVFEGRLVYLPVEWMNDGEGAPSQDTRWAYIDDLTPERKEKSK